MFKMETAATTNILIALPSENKAARLRYCKYGQLNK